MMKPSFTARIGLWIAGAAVRDFVQQQDAEILRLRQELNELKSAIIITLADSTTKAAAELRRLALATRGADPQCRFCKGTGFVPMPGMPRDAAATEDEIPCRCCP